MIVRTAKLILDGEAEGVDVVQPSQAQYNLIKRLNFLQLKKKKKKKCRHVKRGEMLDAEVFSPIYVFLFQQYPHCYFA